MKAHSSNRRLITLTSVSKIFFCCVIVVVILSRILAVLETGEPRAVVEISRDIQFTNLRPNRSESKRLTTVVTGIWLFSHGKKHTVDDYIRWIHNFKNGVDGNLIIYTNKQNSTLFDDMVRENVILSTKYNSPFEIPCIKPYEFEYRNRQWKIDPERDIHIPELYAVWNGKNCLIKEVAQSNPFQSRYFFWIDIGSLRVNGSNIHAWPDPGEIKSLFKDREDEPVFGSISTPDQSLIQYYNISSGPINIDLLLGGFFGGSLNGILRFAEDFWYIHDRFLSEGFFVGKDQDLMNTLLFTTLRNATVVPFWRVDETKCGIRWLYFYHQLVNHKNDNDCPAVEVAIGPEERIAIH